MAESLLEVRGLRKHFGGLLASDTAVPTQPFDAARHVAQEFHALAPARARQYRGAVAAYERKQRRARRNRYAIRIDDGTRRRRTRDAQLRTLDVHVELFEHRLVAPGVLGKVAYRDRRR